MRTITTFIAVAAMVSQVALPALAQNLGSRGPFAPNTVLGWRHVAEPAAMLYFRMGGETRAPRLGLMVTGAHDYVAGEPRFLNSPRMLDFGITSSQPWRADAWTASIDVANRVAWSSTGTAPDGSTPHLFEGGWTWVAVGALTVGIVAGTLALTNRGK